MKNNNIYDTKRSKKKQSYKKRATCYVDYGLSTKKTSVLMFPILIFLFILGLILSIKLGAISISWTDLYNIIIYGDSPKTAQVLYNIRLPRIIIGFLTGMNLALAGCILQGILRNPLADPGIIGITSGAGLAAMVIMILFPSFVSLVPIGAFLGAILAAFLVYGISWQGGLNPLRLILAGVAVATFLGGFNTILAVFFPDRIQGTVSWMAGGFVGRSWNDIWLILPYTIIGIIASMFSIQSLTLLNLGDEVSKTLGLHVERARLILLILAGLLSASAVSVAGMLGFVGLIVPHVTRLLVGSDYRYLLPTTTILGGVLIIFADTFARLIMPPAEIPVGILMSFLGAPFFLYLLKGVGKR